MRPESLNSRLDLDLELFREIAHPINRSVRRLLAADPHVADMLDYAASVDHLLGVGLAAAQVFLVAAARHHRVPKGAVLDLGPRQGSGLAAARLINHGANFWKHADEWDYSKPSGVREAILSAFSTLGIVDDDRPLYELVSRLGDGTGPDLAALLPLLEEWRTALEERFPR